MQASVPVVDIDVPSQNVLFHPVNFKVAKRHAIPHADGWEAVPAGQRVGQKVGHISAPELCYTRVGQPHLNQDNVAEGLEVALLGRWGGDRPEVGNRLWRGRGDAEGEILPNAWDEARVEDLAHAWRLGTHRMANVVAESIVEGPRWVVGGQVGGGEEWPDGKAGDGDYCLRRWRTWEVGVEVEAGGLGLLWAHGAVVPDGAGRPGGDW